MLRKLYIKYMVSLRCKMLVGLELDGVGIRHGIIELGEVDVYDPISEEQMTAFSKALLLCGLVIILDKRSILIERIKCVIIEMVHYEDEVPKMNFSDFLSEKLNHDYTYMANLFSEVKGMTIEQYIIHHKIERAKELLIYNDINLTEIAYKLNYSSVAHLSNQFKKVTGLTPTFFKSIRTQKRTLLEDI